MTPSKAILIGSGIIALSIIIAAAVLPEGGLLSGSSVEHATKGGKVPRYQIVETEHGRAWRLDTKSGELTVCRLSNDRLICANSTTATQLPKVTPEELALQEKKRREESKEMLDRFMSFFERIIDLARKHGSGDQPPVEDDSVEKL